METTKKDKWNSNTVLFARRALEYAGVLEHTPEGSVLNRVRCLTSRAFSPPTTARFRRFATSAP